MMIAQSDLFAGSTHSGFTYLIAIVVVLVGVYFAIFKPAANFTLGYSPILLGYVAFARDISFAKVIAVIQVLGSLYIIAKYVLKRDKEHKTMFFRKNVVVFGLFFLLWLKIIIDCVTGGMDEFRSLALKQLLMSIIAPLCLMVFDVGLNGSKKATEHAITGMVVFAVIFLVAALPTVFIEGGFRSAFSAQYSSEEQFRFAALGSDPINYGRFFFFGLCGCILMSFCIKNIPLKWACYSMSLCFFVFIVASGTRQFLLASMCFIFLIFKVMRMNKLLYSSIFLIICTVSTLGFLENVTSYIGKSGSVLDRFSLSLVSNELADNRGAIWRQAYSATLDNFALGVGFRKFGDPYEHVNPETKESMFVLDSAHGFFQDLFVEHGIFIGCVFFGFYLRGLWFALRSSKSGNVYYGNLLLIIGLSLSVAEFFSGSVFGSVGVYLSMIFAYCDEDALLRSKEAKAITHPRLVEVLAARRPI